MRNSTTATQIACPTCDFTLQPGQLAFHPGPHGELSVVRWVCPRSGLYDTKASFLGLGKYSTVRTYIYFKGDEIYHSDLNGEGGRVEFSGPLYIKTGQLVDAAVDFGADGSFGGDATGLEFTLQRSEIPRPAKGLPTVANGFVVDIVVIDGGEGYTEAPKVQIIGSGSGAAAQAILVDGQVDSFKILSPGSGYGDGTTVVIAPPSSAPSMRISVHVIRLTLSVSAGKRYVVESSNDLKQWQTVSDFVADAATVIRDFDVGDTGKFFNIREVVP